jgi:hypothetical protein
MENTKEKVQTDLIERFGFCDEVGFRNAIARGEVKKAKDWLEYVIRIKAESSMPLWRCHDWLDDRYEELDEDTA